jgi:hypothetical protein
MKVGPDGYLSVLSLYRGGDDCVPDNLEIDNDACIQYSNPSAIEGVMFRILRE